MEQREKSLKTGLVNLGGFMLFCGVGLSSWLLVNAIFIEVPYFIDTLPEGEAIASILSLLIQLCNIFPVIYVVLYSYCHIPHRVSIFALSACAIATSIFLATTWDIIIVDHSLCLFLFTYVSGVIGCMSVVIYYPFASRFSPFLTSAVSLGMGFTGLIASLLGILQQQFDISVSGYFGLNTLILVCSCACFIGTLWKGFKPLSTDPIINVDPEDVVVTLSQKTLSQTLPSGETQQTQPEPPRVSNSYGHCLTVNYTSWILILNQFSICFMYYFLLGLIPYSVAYLSDGGSVLSRMYIGGMILGSVGRFLCTWKIFRFKSLLLLLGFSVAQFILSLVVGFQCFSASKQWIPEEWIWVIVFCYVIFSALNGYEDTLIYQIAAVSQQLPSDIERITRFIGLSNQAGSFTGSILTFILVIIGVVE